VPLAFAAEQHNKQKYSIYMTDRSPITLACYINNNHSLTNKYIPQVKL